MSAFLRCKSPLTSIAAPYLKLPVNQEAMNSVTRGLVGDTSFAVLPDVSPRTTFVLTLASQIVSRTSLFIPSTLLTNEACIA